MRKGFAEGVPSPLSLQGRHRFTHQGDRGGVEGACWRRGTGGLQGESSGRSVSTRALFALQRAKLYEV